MVSPFKKYEVKVIADKTANTVYSFTNTPNPRVPPLPIRSMGSFYNGYTEDMDPQPTFSSRPDSKPILRTRSLSPVKQHSRKESHFPPRRNSEMPHSSVLFRTSSESELVSPRRVSQSDCTDSNCLNLLHAHAQNKSPKLRPFSRTPSPQPLSISPIPKSLTASYGEQQQPVSCDTPRDPPRDTYAGIRRNSSLDKLCEALRNVDMAMKKGAPPDILSGYGVSLEFLTPNKTKPTGSKAATSKSMCYIMGGSTEIIQTLFS